MTKMRIRIKDGVASAIYSDDIVPYLEAMPGHTVSRASHVEPDNKHWHGGNWVVDMAPVRGGIHYKDEQGRPFLERGEALAFEVRELKRLLKLGGTEDVGTHSKERGGGNDVLRPRYATDLAGAGRSDGRGESRG